MIKFRPSILPGICWITISTVLLTLPGTSLPSENWLDKIWFDKWVHIGIFSMLVFLFCWGVQKKYSQEKWKNIFITITLTCIAYGIVMEYVQKYFIPNRSFDRGDIIADIIGCLAGWWLAKKQLGRSVKK